MITLIIEMIVSTILFYLKPMLLEHVLNFFVQILFNFFFGEFQFVINTLLIQIDQLFIPTVVLILTAVRKLKSCGS